MALSQHEENVLKQIARDRTPAMVVNPQTVPNTNESERALGEHIDRSKARSNGWMSREFNVNADEEVRSRLQKAGLSSYVKLMLNGKTSLEPGEAFSIGISRDAILTLGKNELRDLIEVRFRQAYEEGSGLRPNPAAPVSRPRRIFDQVKRVFVEVGA